jgi:hypothetical protein
MNWTKGLKRITLLMAIVAAIVGGIYIMTIPILKYCTAQNQIWFSTCQYVVKEPSEQEVKDFEKWIQEMAAKGIDIDHKCYSIERENHSLEQNLPSLEEIRPSLLEDKKVLFWRNLSKPKLIGICILAGLAGSSTSFLGVWFVVWFGGSAVYKVILWLISGFHTGDITMLKKITNKHLEDALNNIQSGQKEPSMEKYFRTAEYILLEAKEFVDGAWKMIECNKCNASLALSRWGLEASMNLLWAVDDKGKTEQRLTDLVGEALRNEANLNEGKANLWPEQASVLESKARKAREMRKDLAVEELASLDTRIRNIKEVANIPNPYVLYRICCSSAHPSLRVWERFRNIGNETVTLKSIDNKRIACWMAAASIFYLVSSVYCLTELGNVQNLKDCWSKQVAPLLSNIR